MFIARLQIANFRCFTDQLVEFCPGLNVLIGENNSGKTTVISALRLVLDRGHRRRLTYFDFHQPTKDRSKPPEVKITVTFRSTDNDTVEDKALVANWLTRLDPPWEASITYKFALEPEDETACAQALKAVPQGDEEEFRNVI